MDIFIYVGLIYLGFVGLLVYWFVGVLLVKCRFFSFLFALPSKLITVAEKIYPSDIIGITRSKKEEDFEKPLVPVLFWPVVQAITSIGFVVFLLIGVVLLFFACCEFICKTLYEKSKQTFQATIEFFKATLKWACKA